jgi:dihydroxyacetone kinase-like predicted kinase
VEKLRTFVLSMGDSVVFAEDSEIVKIHVHTNDPGKVLSEALKFGSLYTVKEENM